MTVDGNHKSQSRSSSVVIAEWNVRLGVEPKDGEKNEKRPVRINHFAKHTTHVGTIQHAHILVHVSYIWESNLQFGNMILLNFVIVKVMVMHFLYHHLDNS